MSLHGARQTQGSAIDAGKLRMKLVEEGIVTFKVTSKNGPKFDKAMEFSFGRNGHDVTLLEVEGDIPPEQRRFTTPGIGGIAGADTYVRWQEGGGMRKGRLRSAGCVVARMCMEGKQTTMCCGNVLAGRLMMGWRWVRR